LAETAGVWYVNNYLNVAVEKIPDAIFVLHFSVLATVFTLVGVPFQGLIIARERFLIRASVEIFNSLLKLIFILLLVLYMGNKLRAYAFIMAILIIIPVVFYYAYCWIKEREIVQWRMNRNRADYIDMFSFTGWILIGTIAYIGVRQGAAVIINLFFGTVLNAAFGIATQINNYTMMFVQNLNQAAVPQIMKSQSSGDTGRSLMLVYSISKYAFFIMLLPAIPIILSIDDILLLWLKNVPEFTKQFSVLMIINGLISVTASGFDAVIQATGKIRKIQIWYSIITLSALPIAYFLFKIGYPPYSIVIANLSAQIVLIIVASKILTGMSDFKIPDYISKTIIPALLVCIVIVPLFLLRHFFGHGLIDVILFSMVAIILILFSIYLLGLSKHEKHIIATSLSNFKFNK